LHRRLLLRSADGEAALHFGGGMPEYGAEVGHLSFFLKVTTSFAVLPGWISGVVLPLILKSCNTWPTFAKLNVTLPSFAIVEGLKKVIGLRVMLALRWLGA
jgi:hypothetical protein